MTIAWVQSLLLACWLVSPELLPWEVGLPARRGVAVALLVGPGKVWLAALPSWSVRSHELAVAHGQICRWSSSWAIWGWMIPGVHLWLPFAMLRARGRFYRCAALDRLWWSQAAFGLTALLALSRWYEVAAVVAALGFYWLRLVVRSIVAAQILEEQSATAERVFG